MNLSLEQKRLASIEYLSGQHDPLKMIDESKGSCIAVARHLVKQCNTLNDAFILVENSVGPHVAFGTYRKQQGTADLFHLFAYKFRKDTVEIGDVTIGEKMQPINVYNADNELGIQLAHKLDGATLIGDAYYGRPADMNDFLEKLSYSECIWDWEDTTSFITHYNDIEQSERFAVNR